MLNFIIILELSFITIAGAMVLPDVLRYWKTLEHKKKILASAWSAMLIGQHQIFTHEGAVRELSAFNAGATYQIVWMMIAGLVALPAILSSKIHGTAWKLPIVAFAAYIFFAFGSTFLSAAPAMTLYRSMQITVVLALVLMAYSEAIKTGRADYLFNVTVFWLSLLLVSVLFGALVMPERALVPNRGVLGYSLQGVIPTIHQNELGLMSALGFLIGLVKSFGMHQKKLWKYYWVSLAVISGTILFLSQARTSLAAAVLALAVLGFVIPRMRALAYSFTILGVASGFFYLITGTQIGIEAKVEEYARRGVSDEQIESLSGRTGLWAIGWKMFKDAPVLGHGFQAGVRYKAPEYGLPIGTNMHSSHMQVLVDLGLLGYSAWIVFVLGVCASVFSKYKKSDKGGQEHVIAALALLLVFVIMFRSVLGHVLVSLQLNLLIFFSLYLYSIADSKREQRKSLESTTERDGSKSRILSHKKKSAINISVNS